MTWDSRTATGTSCDGSPRRAPTGELNNDCVDAKSAVESLAVTFTEYALRRCASTHCSLTAGEACDHCYAVLRGLTSRSHTERLLADGPHLKADYTVRGGRVPDEVTLDPALTAPGAFPAPGAETGDDDPRRAAPGRRWCLALQRHDRSRLSGGGHQQGGEGSQPCWARLRVRLARRCSGTTSTDPDAEDRSRP